jgi:hypothetical protein
MRDNTGDQGVIQATIIIGPLLGVATLYLPSGLVTLAGTRWACQKNGMPITLLAGQLTAFLEA